MAQANLAVEGHRSGIVLTLVGLLVTHGHVDSENPEPSPGLSAVQRPTGREDGIAIHVEGRRARLPALLLRKPRTRRPGYPHLDLVCESPVDKRSIS